MKILVLNLILYTSEGRQLPRVDTIKDTMIYGMCLGFVRLGHEVTLVAMDDYRPLQPEEYDFEVVWLRNPLRRVLPVSLPFPARLNSYLRRQGRDYDMVLTSEAFAFPTLMASRHCGDRTLVWQELSLHQRKWHQLPSRLWHRVVIPWCFGAVRAVVPRSLPAHEFIRQYMSPVSDEVVDHGINLDWLPVSSHVQRQFITIGQLIDRKGIDLIIDRFYQFCQLPVTEGYKLLIAGRGPCETALKLQVKRLGLEQRVQFLGFLSHEQLGHHLSRSVATLVATHRDLNMVSITESVACGTPVITCCMPNTAQWVQQHGLGIALDDWGAEQMLAVATDDSYARRCRAMRPRLSCEAAAQRLIDVFNTMIPNQDAAIE